MPSILALSSLFFLTDAKNWLNLTFFSSGVEANSFAVESLAADFVAAASSSSTGSALDAAFGDVSFLALGASAGFSAAFLPRAPGSFKPNAFKIALFV